MSWNCKLGQNSEEAKLNILKNSSHQKTILMQKIPHVDTKTHFLELLTHVLIFASLIKCWLAVVAVYKVGSKIANVGHSLAQARPGRLGWMEGEEFSELHHSQYLSVISFQPFILCQYIHTHRVSYFNYSDSFYWIVMVDI